MRHGVTEVMVRLALPRPSPSARVTFIRAASSTSAVDALEIAIASLLVRGLMPHPTTHFLDYTSHTVLVLVLTHKPTQQDVHRRPELGDDRRVDAGPL